MSNGAYAAAYEQSISDPTTFWGNAAKAVEWITEPTSVLDDSNPPFYRWFRGGSLNTCFNALDRHVRDGRGDQAALIYDSPVTSTVRPPCRRTASSASSAPGRASVGTIACAG